LVNRWPNATEILERLISRLGDESGPLEHFVAEWTGPDVVLAAKSIDGGAPREMAMSVVDELGESWGPTGDPTWVEGVVPGFGDDDGAELDYMLALYRRPRIYAYARLRGDAGDPPSKMRLILGVVRKPPDHGD